MGIEGVNDVRTLIEACNAAQGGRTQEPPDGTKSASSSALDVAHPSGAELEALRAKAERQ